MSKALVDDGRIALKGAPGSPYTRKMLALLRYRQLPYRFIQGMVDGAENDLPEAKVQLLPTFYFVDDRWVQAEYEDDTETKKIDLFSQSYFELLDKHAELAKVLALGERVVFRIDETWYETVEPASDNSDENAGE